jgi:raffinose/stachyose/melibiose transport system substrate-binding protein
VLENEAFKSKLTTLLQSPDAPDFFHSWGGGVFQEQVRAGVLRPIDDLLSQEARDAVGQAGIAHFTGDDGKIYGVARNVQGVMIWYNKRLLAEGGVDPASLSTWDGFLAGVQKLKDAGITPLALGGKDKWPAQFYWAYLIIRNAGHDVFYAAKDGEGDGFNIPEVVRAGDMLNELAALEPFQEGYQAAGYGDACAVFGDQKAAMHLMGEWDYNCSKDSSADGMGVGDDNLGLIPFPSIEGGKGMPTDSLGGMMSSPPMPTTRPWTSSSGSTARTSRHASRPRASTSRSARVRPTRCRTSSTSRSRNWPATRPGTSSSSTRRWAPTSAASSTIWRSSLPRAS